MANAQDFTIPDVHTFFFNETAATETVSSGKKPRTALVLYSNISSLKALGMAIEKGLVDAILIGDEQLAKKNAAENDVNLDSAKFININEPDMAVKTSVKMACADELDILMSGRVPAVNLLQFILDKSAGFVSKGNTVSHVAVLKPALYEKLLFLTDAAVNMEPNLKTKLAIINNAVKVANLVGGDMPRVAIIAAVENGLSALYVDGEFTALRNLDPVPMEPTHLVLKTLDVVEVDEFPKRHLALCFVQEDVPHLFINVTFVFNFNLNLAYNFFIDRFRAFCKCLNHVIIKFSSF